MDDIFAKIIQQALIDANNMALIEEAHSTADFLEKCSKFIRYANKKQTDILVKDELKALDTYLELRRFHDTIECIINVKTKTAVIGHMELIRLISESIKVGRTRANIDDPNLITISEGPDETNINVEIRMPDEDNASSYIVVRRTIEFK